MTKTVYKVAAREGSDRYQAEVGTEVELDLPDLEERAVVAAGWLEPVKKTEAKKEAKT